MTEENITLEFDFIEVKPFSKQLKCPKCGNGYLIYPGYTKENSRWDDDTKKGYYIHTCNNPECNYQLEIESQTFPIIIYSEAKKLDSEVVSYRETYVKKSNTDDNKDTKNKKVSLKNKIWSFLNHEKN